MKKYKCSHALVLAVLFYLVQHVIFFTRFGSINTQFNILDAVMVLAGFLVFRIAFCFLNRLETKSQRMWLWVAIVIMLPVAFMGALMGGLLGWIGIILYATIPFTIVVSLTYFLVKQFLGNRNPSPATEMPEATDEPHN